MKYKTWLAIFLSLLLLMSGFAAQADEIDAAQEDGVGENAETARGESIDHLTVASTTQIRGDFFSDLWGNGTSDIDIRYLIHGYNLIQWNGAEGQFTADPSVAEIGAVMDNEEGDRSYVFVLADDLYYSDGTQITAWDYAFSFLLHTYMRANGFVEMPDHRNYVLGYEKFAQQIAEVEEGETPEWHYEGGARVFPDGTKACLPGFRVLAEDTLMITLDHEYLPFFYEVGLLSCAPYPIHVIAPGVKVMDDGQGVYLANVDETVDEPIFSRELLTKTILDPESGYMVFPSVGCGPYLLKSFDGLTAEFEKNPLYKGDALGRLPLIKYLTFTLGDNDTMVEKLKNGEYDVLNKVTKASTLVDAMALVREGGFLMTNYPRTGLTQIAFVWERPTVSSLAVRQAIAWCMDRDAIVRDYTGGFGMRADGYYGLGQWMVGLVQGTIPAPVEPPEDEGDSQAYAAYEEELAAWEEMSLDDLTVYTVDTDKARALLDADGWELNDDGLREKDGVVLDLTLAYPEGNAIAETFEQNLTPYLEEVGIRLTLTPLPMSDLLRRYYRQPVDGDQERDMDMIYLGTNFELVFDPSVQFTSGASGGHYANNGDEELYELATAMRETEPGNVLEYVQEWLEFQKRVNEQLPLIPIYTNVYFDFFTEKLHDYDVDENLAWSKAILGAELYEEVEEEEEVGVEFEVFGDDALNTADNGEIEFFD